MPPNEMHLVLHGVAIKKHGTAEAVAAVAGDEGAVPYDDHARCPAPRELRFPEHVFSISPGQREAGGGGGAGTIRPSETLPVIGALRAAGKEA